jgi:hypothetical protein
MSTEVPPAHTDEPSNRHKVEELSQLSSDLQNLLAATEIATLFLDRELRILRFTPRVSELFNIRISDAAFYEHFTARGKRKWSTSPRRRVVDVRA